MATFAPSMAVAVDRLRQNPSRGLRNRWIYSHLDVFFIIRSYGGRFEREVNIMKDARDVERFGEEGNF